MRVNVSVDNARLLLRLRNGEKRFAYAVVNALNATGKRIQKEMQAKVVGDFTVRQKAFIARNVAKIERSSFANVRERRPYIEIEVGKAERLLLASFEKGGERFPFVGKNLAVPVIGGPARPTLKRRVPKAWTFEALQLQATTTRSGAETIASANRRVYVVPGVGVFERRAEGSRMVYAFVPRMTLDERLGFLKTANRVTAVFFREELERETIKAIQFNAGRV